MIRGRVAGGGKSAAVFALALIVLAFALQPCFAGLITTASHCCPHHAPKCHGKAQIEFCAMTSTAFAAPEQPGASIVFDAGAPAAVTSTVLASVTRDDAGYSAWSPDRGRSYLLFSVFLI